MDLTTSEIGSWPVRFSELKSAILDNLHNVCGLTPLQRAIVFNSDDDCYWLAAMLLQRGANPNALSSRGAPALHLAVERGNYRVVGLLLDHQADRSLIWHGLTALEFAKHRRDDIAMADEEARDLNMILDYLAQ